MSAPRARVLAVYRKELREYRRNGSIVATMAVLPLGVVIFPLILVTSLPASAVAGLQGDPLLILLGIPALVPSVIASYAVVGERVQSTLEPLLTTPIRREELLLAKALATLLPSLAIAYAVYAGFALCTVLFADPAVAAAVLSWPAVAGQVLFTPLLSVLSIWVAMTISTRAGDVRVAQQLGTLAVLPVLLLAYLVTFGVIALTPVVVVAITGVVLLLDVLGWRVVSAAFDPERLLTSTR